MPHRIHTDNPDKDCERREDQQGASAWVRKNMTIPAAVAIFTMLGALLMGVYGFVGKVESGAKAAAKVEAIERDYVGRREMESAIGGVSTRVDRIEKKIDRLTTAILKRLPDDEE